MNAGEVASVLRRQIISARYLQNERLPSERALSEEFGVARGTLREALKQLEQSGFVQRRAGSGSYVVYSETNYSRSIAETTSPLELIDARFALEPQIVRLAVLHATEQNIAKLEERLRTIMEAGFDPLKFSQADEAFHVALADCTKNSLLIWMAKRVNEVRGYSQWAKMRELTLTPEMINHYNRQHKAILEAIRARDAEGAARAIKEHLSAARHSLVEATTP
ncbi:MAG: FadR/GntR family transcriptional regulator [Rhodovibrionaceae bacterium]|nr:FadR/GntR family transcriptional regulator [Rhodovibrionaceae bacterium]